VFLGRWGLLLGLLRAASRVLGTNPRFPPSFSWSCASPVPVNEALAHLKQRNPMIFKITHKAAQLLAIQDAKRAMRQSDYEGVTFSCCEAFNDHHFEGLGDVLILNPGATVEEDVLQTYETAYLETWHRA
jgi:hypothetical protein